MTEIQQTETTGLEIAVIGMGCRFPGAQDIEEYWENLSGGIESISFFIDAELEKVGVDRSSLENPNYMKAGAILETVEYFDASFFGYTPRESQLMDPQVRLFHECAWEALEDAGYDSTTYSGLIGVYAGAFDSIFWKGNVLLSLGNGEEGFSSQLLSSSNYLCTWLSYALNLKGPSVVMYSACSTSLVSIHMGCRALLGGECHMVVAGGVSVFVPQEIGYTYQEGMILSEDGHTRTFDARATGSIFGCGIGLVILKPFEDAISDGDHIYAIIKGTAVNNDGNRKVGFTAPSVKGQVEVIRAALRMAEVEPESISYIEAHGTATALGDCIEMKALREVFLFNPNQKKSCAIGTVKSNFGHLNTAAGVAGFIKTVLALKHKMIPPSLHFDTSNPEIDFNNSPFYVNTRLSQWKNEKYPLRAGVSAFGIGGTNAHVVLEEVTIPKKILINQTNWDWQLFTFSARTEAALDRMTENFATHLKKNPEINLADVAYTLHVGRRLFSHRRMVVSSGVEDIISLLTPPISRKVPTFNFKEVPYIIFMFPGLGSQYINMGWDLYQKESVFRYEMDLCFDILKPLIGYDLKEILYPGSSLSGMKEDVNIGNNTPYSDMINYPLPDIDQFEIAQLVVFIFEYSLAKLLIKWGISPDAMIGYSFGEYVAACLSGVFSLENALELVVIRGQLIMAMPEGRMISVPLPRQELESFIKGDISISIDNGSSCIVSGESGAIEAFEKKMKEKRIVCMPLQHASRALHSNMMKPILTKFRDTVSEINLNSPRIPFISNLTGTWHTETDACNPEYWSNHMALTVRFAEGIERLVKEPNGIFVEIGPGRDISTLVQRFMEDKPDKKVLSLVRSPQKQVSDIYFLLNKIGYLWLYGKGVHWHEFHSSEKRIRLPLPTYPFERQRYPVEENLLKSTNEMLSNSALQKKQDISDWFYIPYFKPSLLPADQPEKVTDFSACVVFIDGWGIGEELINLLEQIHQPIILVRAGKMYKKELEGEYIINPGENSHYQTLFNELYTQGIYPSEIVHLWSVMHRQPHESEEEWNRTCQELGFYSLIFLTKSLENFPLSRNTQITVVSNNMQMVYGDEVLYPEKVTMLGPVNIIPREYPNLSCRIVDIDLPEPGGKKYSILVRQILNEINSKTPDPVIIYRGNNRLVQTFEKIRLGKRDSTSFLKKRGVYLITGGLGDIGLLLAKDLARSVNARMVLVGRSEFPAQDQWEQWLTQHHDKNESTCIKIMAIQEVIAFGGEVLVCQADVSDQKQMEAVIRQAESRFGIINGVIHAALQIDGGVIHSITPKKIENVFASKIRGTLVLERIFKNYSLDFFILFSSISAVCMEIGEVAYAAGSAFMDAFAQYKSLTCTDSRLTISINWDAWQDVGGALKLAKERGKSLGLSAAQTKIEKGILSLEGVDAFNRIIGGQYRVPRIVVSTWNLHERLKAHGNASSRISFENFNASKSRHILPELDNEYLPPRNDIEQILVEIWGRFFGFEKVGIKDDFFELGGDSLKAIIMTSLIQKELNVNVSIGTIFSQSTIETLARYITDNAPKNTNSSITPVEDKGYYIVSSAQKRLYILQQMEPEGTAFNMPQIFGLEGELAPQKFENIFHQLIERHESFRTCFILQGDEPVQKISRQMEFVIEYKDIERYIPNQGVAGREFFMEFHRSPNSVPLASIIENFVQPFDLNKPPLLRVLLIKLVETYHIMMLDMHHIISDGVSQSVLIEDIINLYKGEDLRPLKFRYRDFSEWQNNMLYSEKIAKQERYWLNRFKGEIPILAVPVDHPHTSGQSFAGEDLDFEISEELTNKLKILIAKSGATLYISLLTLFFVLLSKYTQQTDIIIGSPIAGRGQADLDNVVGIFINVLLMRSFPQPGKTFLEFLQEVKTYTLEAFENQDYQFDKLIERLKVKRDSEKNPLYNVIFALMNMEKPKIQLPGLNIEPLVFEEMTAKTELRLAAMETERKIMMKWTYVTALFERETIVEMARHYVEIVDQVLNDNKIKLENIKISHNLVTLKPAAVRDDQSGFNF